VSWRETAVFVYRRQEEKEERKGLTKLAPSSLPSSFHLIPTGPAVKVPGLVFCAGQTATGEIGQATVSRRIFLGERKLRN
jgi:hypothetical protein